MVIKLVILLMIQALTYLTIAFIAWDISWVTTMGDFDPAQRFAVLLMWAGPTAAVLPILFIE